MPLAVASGAPTIFIRRSAYERAALSRAAIDELLALTDDEFRVEGDLVALGPIYEDAALQDFIAALEKHGLVYFDEFFELTGNWPEWLQLVAVAGPVAGPVSSSS